MEFITESEMEQIGQEVLEKFIIPSYDAKGHNASGELRNSFRVRSEPGKVIFSGFDYAQYLIIGRRPNKDQSPEAITNWARWFGKNVFDPWVSAKGLSLNPYAVAYKIAREGTKQYREGGDDDFLNILESKEVEEYLKERVGDFIRVNIANTLRNDLKALRNDN